jgi:phosphate/sulfate permease
MRNIKNMLSNVLMAVAEWVFVLIILILINYGICWVVKLTHMFSIPAIVSAILTAFAMGSLLPEEDLSKETGIVSSILFVLFTAASAIFAFLVLYTRADRDLGLQQSMSARGEFLLIYGTLWLFILFILGKGYKKKRFNILTAILSPPVGWIPIAIMAALC